MKKIFFIIYFLLFNFVVTQESFSQKPSKERGDPTLRRKTNIDGNQLRTTIFNYGYAGRAGVVPDEVPFEWPKNTKQHYIALVALFVGGEVKDNSGNNIHIVDVPNFRSSPTGKSWNFEPVGGYLKPDAKSKIAKSDNPNTWPLTWPDKISDTRDPGWKGSWNGYFGKNQFNADQELFYRASDDRYDRYNYSPDTTDMLRRGLGIMMDVRAMEWSQILVNDVLFILHSVKNDGTKDIKKAGVTLWIADLVGGDGDSGDDLPYFDLINDVAWMTDKDGIGNNAFPSGQKVGVAAISYLESPGNATDNIDNDGDGEFGSPKVTGAMIAGEIPGDGIDNNNNNLIDEDSTHIAFGTGVGIQLGVGFKDRIDNNDNGESGSPTITQLMLSGEILNDAIDNNNNGAIDEGTEDVGKKYKDAIDNNNNGESGSPIVTQAMVDTAAKYFKRFKLPSNKFLYDVDSSDVGKKYADGIDNDNNGAIDELIDELIDEMIDEARDDGIDNDGDWKVESDDVGLDGVANTQDVGEGDGKPTSGAGTSFPGEPNIDVTDVSESDQIGLTNVQYKPAGAINFSTVSDEVFWGQFMTPGSYYDPTKPLSGDNDLFVSSGFFPLKAGQTERISVAVIMGSNKEEALQNKDKAQQTYNEDYQFAKAPIAPTLTAVPGNKRITLYWDDKSEYSYDNFLAALGQQGYDFEGYKIYRSTDPSFLDIFKITDGKGNPTFYKPIAQFDKKNNISGYHPVTENGILFYLGSNTGLKHEWVDTTVQNGQTYYYAITGYDYGWTNGNISPSESPIAVSLGADGAVELGRNVIKIVPNAPASGYVKSGMKELKHVTGSSTGKIFFKVVDPNKMKENHTYRLTFEDTLIAAVLQTDQDTFKTKNFTLVDLTNPIKPETLITKSKKLNSTDEVDLIDGFRLAFENESAIGLNTELTKWSRSNIYKMDMQPWNIGFTRGVGKPSDYKIIFGDVGVDTSLHYLPYENDFIFPMPATRVNFSVYNLTENNKKIKFAFKDVNLEGGLGVFSVGSDVNESDVIAFYEKDAKGDLALTWRWNLIFDSLKTAPKKGDTAYITLRKPFLKGDIYELTTSAHYIDNLLAKETMNKIKVVPNPYIAAATWEARNPFSSGRGPRSIHFNHLPAVCTIKIYSVSGELVQTIEHNNFMTDGSAEWNLLTRDNLPASYGVYIFHVNAPGVGEKIGRFAIIK
ncbi:MAG: hypothetical protein O3A55_04455 [Bacteroidetes bacterium]|nr:hypothetical protein [Bacteroidota bacterium]